MNTVEAALPVKIIWELLDREVRRLDSELECTLPCLPFSLQGWLGNIGQPGKAKVHVVPMGSRSDPWYHCLINLHLNEEDMARSEFQVLGQQLVGMCHEHSVNNPATIYGTSTPLING